MNYVDLAIAVLTAVIVYIGFRRGLLVSLISMLRLVIAVPLSAWVGGAYSQQIYDSFIEEYAIERITSKLSDTSQISDFAADLRELVSSFSYLFSNTAELNIADSLTPEGAAVYIADNIIEPAAVEIVKIVLTILTFLIFYVITGIIVSVVKKLREKKHLPFHNTNSFLGGVFGFVKAVTVIFVVGFAADYIIGAQLFDNEFVSQLGTSKVLNFVNNFNPLITS